MRELSQRLHILHSKEVQRLQSVLLFQARMNVRRIIWKIHKADCKPAQKTRNEGISLDQTHPFDSTIAAFEAQEFTQTSFRRFLSSIEPLYFTEADTDTHHSDLDGVTESGYLHLITLAVKALNEFPDNAHVNAAAVDVFMSYTIKHCKDTTDISRAEALFAADALEPILRSPNKYSAFPGSTYNAWFILSKMTQIHQSSHFCGYCGPRD